MQAIGNTMGGIFSQIARKDPAIPENKKDALSAQIKQVGFKHDCHSQTRENKRNCCFHNISPDIV